MVAPKNCVEPSIIVLVVWFLKANSKKWTGICSLSERGADHVVLYPIEQL